MVRVDPAGTIDRGHVKISLVVSTIGRTRHFARLLDSLVDQSFKDFEVIVVDQSGGMGVRERIAAYRDALNIIHTSSQRGVSRGRNCGLALARGTLVAFPDDDCWYQRDLLRQIDTMFNDTGIDGVFGRCIDACGENAAGRHERFKTFVDRRNVWRCGVSATIFFRKSVFARIGDFDTSIGLGSGTSFLSGEETDLILRGLQHGCVFQYDPSVVVFHDSASAEGFSRELAKSWSYGLGMGLVLRRHGYAVPFVLYSVARPVLGTAVALCMGRFRLAGIRIVRAAARFEG
jgi:glycosyltransferase involved in cell wall biosynthesis